MSYVMQAPSTLGGQVHESSLERPLGYCAPYILPNDNYHFLPLYYDSNDYDLYAMEQYQVPQMVQLHRQFASQQQTDSMRLYNGLLAQQRQEEEAQLEVELMHYDTQSRADFQRYTRRLSQSEASIGSRRPSIQSEHSSASWSYHMPPPEDQLRRLPEECSVGGQHKLGTTVYVPDQYSSGNIEHWQAASRRSSMAMPNVRPLPLRQTARRVSKEHLSASASSSVSALSPTSPVSQSSWSSHEAVQMQGHVDPNALSLTPLVGQFPTLVSTFSMAPSPERVADTYARVEEDIFPDSPPAVKVLDHGIEMPKSPITDAMPVRAPSPEPSATEEAIWNSCKNDLEYKDIQQENSQALVCLTDDSDDSNDKRRAKSDTDSEYTPHALLKTRAKRKRKSMSSQPRNNGLLPKRGRVPQEQKKKLMLPSKESSALIAHQKMNSQSSNSSRSLTTQDGFESDSDVPLMTKRSDIKHAGEALKSFVCDIRGCDQRFRRSEHLKRHIRSLHTGEKPYGCHVCDKTFSRSDNLAQHMKVHATELESERARLRSRVKKSALQSSLKEKSASRRKAPQDADLQTNELATIKPSPIVGQKRALKST